MLHSKDLVSTLSYQKGVEQFSERDIFMDQNNCVPIFSSIKNIISKAGCFESDAKNC